MQQIPGQLCHQTGASTVPSQAPRSAGGDPQVCSRTSVGRPRKRKRNESAAVDSSKQQRLVQTRNVRDGAWKLEASSLVGNDGGLSSVSAVERLLCIMRYEWDESMQRPADVLVSRTMLVKVVAATTEHDCLRKFLKMGGLLQFDQWLQEAHKWRSSAVEENSAEGGEKEMEDLLLALLGALERLPVDLLALKTCSVGKAVNNLRGHKHQDIQRRAKKLVDTWKKRVETEMKLSGNGALPKRITTEEQTGSVLSPQALDTGHSSLKAHTPSPFPDGSPSEASSMMGRGKFDSVASLCSSHESPSRASSTLIEASSSSLHTGSISHRLPLATYSHVNSVDVAPFQSLENHGAARHAPDTEKTARLSSGHAVPHGSHPRMNAAEGGATRHRRHPHGSKTSTSSATTSLSGPATNEVVALLRSVSSQMKSENACSNDATSRSELNSATAMEFKERSTASVKFTKSQIQMFVNAVPSENSMYDAKSPNSPWERSYLAPRAMSLPPGLNLGSHTVELQGSGWILTDREHHDHISSNVSSPSETSMPVDNLLSEHRRVHQLAYVDEPSPVDTTSRSSHPSAVVEKHASSSRGSSPSAQLKVYNLPLPLPMERVGESSVVVKVTTSPLHRPVGGGFASEADREVAAEGMQEAQHERAVALSSKVLSDASALGNQRKIMLKSRISPAPDAGVSCAVGGTISAEALEVLHVSELKSAINKEQPAKGLAFDLNQMVVVDEGGSEPTLSCRGVPPTPMAPIAVMAAVKGPPSLPCRPSSGDLGWKGSAATSAFRPTQPRQSLERSPSLANNRPDQESSQAKVLMDFDLNVAFASMDDDDLAPKVPSQKPAANNSESTNVVCVTRCCSRAGLDLNRMDGVTASTMDFDLNNGPNLLHGDNDLLMPPVLSSETANNTSGAYSLPVRPPITPITSNVTFPACAPDRYYSVVASGVHSASHHEIGIFPYNIFVQNQTPPPPSGMAAYPAASSSLTAYGSFPSGLSLQDFGGPFVIDRHQHRPQPATIASQPPTLMMNSEVVPAPQVMPPLQFKPSYMMGASSDAISRQAKRGF